VSRRHGALEFFWSTTCKHDMPHYFRFEGDLSRRHARVRSVREGHVAPWFEEFDKSRPLVLACARFKGAGHEEVS